MEYRDAIKSKETRQGRPSDRDAVVQWMMATYFELSSFAPVKFPPHKPSIVAKYECAPLYDAQLRFIS